MIKNTNITAIVCILIVISVIAGLSVYQYSLTYEPSITQIQGGAGSVGGTTQLPEDFQNESYHAYYTGTIEHSGGSRGIGIIGYNAVAYYFPTQNATNATIVTDSTNGKDVDLFILDANYTVIASSTGAKNEQPEVITLNKTVLSTYTNLTAAVQYYCTGPEDRVTSANYYLIIDVYYT